MRAARLAIAAAVAAGFASAAQATTVVIFVRNSAVGTLVMCALAGWLLFPARRPRAPRRDWTILGIIGLMVLTSLYQLFWLRSVVQ